MTNATRFSVLSTQELLQNYNRQPAPPLGEKLRFSGVGSKDVYNITAPFMDRGEQVVAGRVEARESEHAVTRFFHCRDGIWTPIPGTPSFDNLQDPFVSRIHGELVLGGVQVWPSRAYPSLLDYRTVFFRGKSVRDLALFAVGVDFMKDIRLVELEDGRIGMFTRPQGAVGGRGQIGFGIIATLDELTPEAIRQAELIAGQFLPDEWGGANEAHLLANGRLGVLGHIGSFDRRGGKHYYSVAFGFDPYTQETTPLKIIATRQNFVPGTVKKEGLEDVIFSGGLVRDRASGSSWLYTGVSDAESHRIRIPDPFLEFEALPAALPADDWRQSS